jgi:chemotaxis-related protein WspB
MQLFLQIQIGEDGYLLEARRIACILPLAQFKGVLHAPAGVVGIFNFHGAPVPVIDLSVLAYGRPAVRHLSTRLILTLFGSEGVVNGTGPERLVGLIAERATDTIRRGSTDFKSAGVQGDGTPYLGAVTTANGRLWQRIDVPKLLPREVIEGLFHEVGEAT